MILELIQRIIRAEVYYFVADWWLLLLGILTAVSLSVYVGQEQITSWIQRKTKLSISGTVAFGAFTPLCACGTMAVLLSMFVSLLPWGPVMAFLVSSPLTSPSDFIIQSGILGMDIAITILIASVMMGFLAGFLAFILEKKTSFFKGQYRLNLTNGMAKSDCSGPEESDCCFPREINEKSLQANWFERLRLKEFIIKFYELGIKKIILYFMIFVALGEIVNFFIPAEWVLQLFSPGKIYSIPLAAIIGLPIYVSGSASLPLMDTLLEMGIGKGAVIAFMIAGQGTSIAVLMGVSRFVKKRAVTFYVAFMLIGAILAGYLAQLFLN